MAPKNLLEARLVQLRDGRWTKADARLVLDAVERSGDSVWAFARLHGLSAKKIFWWRSQLENDDPPADSESLSFAPVVVTGLGRAPAAVIRVGAIEIDVHEPDKVSARWQASLLRLALRAWDAKEQCARVTYDALRRPVDSYVQPAVGSEVLLSRVVYGELLASPQATNHRGRVYRSYGGDGEATTPSFDFKGLPVSSELKLLREPTAKNDWTVLANQSTIAAMATAAAPLLETTVYASSSTHDALGRVLTAISPDGSEVAYGYNERGALKAVDCKHRGSLTSTPIVAEIRYDVRGRRESITHAANATTTTYAYDPKNYRLRGIETTRTSDNAKLQGLHYHYDPVGNVTDIRDDAQQTVYFQNAVVEAANGYEYDALYRLVEATGREHASQGTVQRSSTQLPPDSSATPMANDPNALRRYTQRYSYDAVGNLETVIHAPAGGTGWTRRYQCRTDGNRLVATSAPGDAAGPLYSNSTTYSHTYPHDVHSNFVSMPHMAAMDWDELDQLQHCKVGSQEVYFQYAGGQRIRRYVEHAGSTTEERIYLGSFELYRKRVNGTLKEEWESLHVSDDTGRIVLVETRTVDKGELVPSPTGIWRFQLSNHLGSAATEVTETGAVISYEEYHPYGTSAYRLVDSQLEVPAKRYRYTGMERDEETGLGYHTARYYAPWLGRWTAADPIGVAGGLNVFEYSASSPVVMNDPAGMAPHQAGDVISTEEVDAWRKDSSLIHPNYKPLHVAGDGYLVVPVDAFYAIPGGQTEPDHFAWGWSPTAMGDVWRGKYSQQLERIQNEQETAQAAQRILAANRVLVPAATVELLIVGGAYIAAGAGASGWAQSNPAIVAELAEGLLFPTGTEITGGVGFGVAGYAATARYGGKLSARSMVPSSQTLGEVDLKIFGTADRLAARGAMPRAASLGLFAEGFVAKTCSTPGTAAFWLRALGEHSGARRHEALHHGLLDQLILTTDMRFVRAFYNKYGYLVNALVLPPARLGQ
ncbi:RHS repeat domain-containing protein [Enhygromyxa salina]|nr:RHS repeat-associated core domain-containing protein [Enhygromyxa salina]